MGQHNPGRCFPLSTSAVRAGALFVCCALSGCAAITNPVVDSVPVRLLPSELLGPSKAGEQTIPLNLLRQPQPAAYQLAPGDVLGIYVEGVIGEKNQALPLHVAPMVQYRDQHRLPPASGYPFPVLSDGTVALPVLDKLNVQGMTLGEAREAIRNAYLKKEQIRPDNERVHVTLLHPRQVQVLVLRQEASSYLFAPEGPVPSGKRNSGHLVHLPAYENDVLHALVQTGGLPEFDAYNEIIIHRDRFHGDKDKALLLQQLDKAAPGQVLPHMPRVIDGHGAGLGGETIRIPLRVPPGGHVPGQLEDIVLQQGDVIFLEARDEQVFFTGGLLPTGKHILPRDQDLDVLEAVSQVRGPLYNGAFGGSNLSGALIQDGIGNPSPSLLIVVRRVPGRGQVRILVDLRRALRDGHERILVQPGDLLILQEKPAEAFARYFTQTFLNVEIFWEFMRTPFASGGLSVAGPNRLPNRLSTIQLNRQ